MPHPLKPLIVFGAFDRHNLGDMLFAHVAQRLVAETRPDARIIVAALAARDLREAGGHAVEAIASVMRRDNDTPVPLLHAGGELLTCTAWEAAVMLQSPEHAQACIARHGARAEDRAAFARATLGGDARAPYVIGENACFYAVGGVSLASGDATLRAEVLTKLRDARTISVRDTRTQAALHAAGIDARLAPDPVTLIATLFSDRSRLAIPRHYIAMQFSADFGDDATLTRLAAQVDALNMDIVLFRAGVAPWHDDLAVYARLVEKTRHAHVTIFESPDVWSIRALIANSAGYAGSSLHGRIVAMSHGLPRVNLLHPDERARTGKQAAYAATWEPAHAPGAVPVDSFADAIRDALNMNRDDLKQQAATLAHAARAEFDTIIDTLLPP